jgi:uncharacterized heparinase superfamily protein
MASVSSASKLPLVGGHRNYCAVRQLVWLAPRYPVAGTRAARAESLATRLCETIERMSDAMTSFRHSLLEAIR